ncbi:MAG: DUF3592 domain-containing protein [Proteobacteria bacterium]|nr:DUF3592 domain-containing protein [Pseudomonadota bacterium]
MAFTSTYRRNTGDTPAAGIAVGIIFILVGIGVASIYYFNYMDWPEVQYEANILSCYHGAKNANLCSIEYKYTYKDQSYSITRDYEHASRGTVSKIYLNPDNPTIIRHRDDLKEGYTVAAICFFLGVLFLVAGILFKRYCNKIQKRRT